MVIVQMNKGTLCVIYGSEKGSKHCIVTFFKPIVV